MANENMNDVVPIRHSSASAVGATAAGAAGGAVKTGVKWGSRWIAAMSIVGAVVAAAWTGGFSLIATPLVNAVLLGAGIGGLLGLVSSPAIGVVTGAVGAAKGGNAAARKVKIENAQARMYDDQLSAQVDAYKFAALTQAQAPVQVYAPTANTNYGFPQQGSAMNPAKTQIGAMQYEGAVNNQELLAAR